MESNKVREGVSLAADITGILAFLAIPATALLVWLRAKLEYSWWVLALAIVTLVGPCIAYLFFKKILPRVQRERSPWTTSHPKKLLLPASELLDWLPDEAGIKRQFAELEKRAKHWDAKAPITQYRLAVKLVQKDMMIMPAVRVISSWRKLSGFFSYMQFMGDGSKSRVQEEFSDLKTSIKSQGFTANPLTDDLKNWREAVVKTYGPIEHLVAMRLMIVCEAELVANKPRLTIEIASWSDEKVDFITKAKATFTPEQLEKL